MWLRLLTEASLAERRAAAPFCRARWFVIAGLDPAIQPFRNILMKIDGCAGQARA
jgi:hypothetical protein